MRQAFLFVLLVAPAMAWADPISFYTINPCRMVDTRTPGYKTNYSPVGAATGGVILFVVKDNPNVKESCGIPVEARALAVNITATEATQSGHVTLWDYSATALEPPGTSSLNFRPGRTSASLAIVPLTDTLGIDMAANVVMAGPGQVHLILDVTGYFR